MTDFGAGKREKRADVDFVDTYSRLMAVGRNRGSADSDAEDRLQDACVRLLEAENAAVVREPQSYFKRILRNLRIDSLRAQSRRTAVPVDETLACSRPGPDKVAEARSDLAIVAKSLEALPPRCREAFGLHRFQDMSYAQIAQHMGISISMVEKHVAEALVRLALAIDK